MIAVDTNLLVRVMVNDDEKQVAASLRALEGGAPVLLLNSVILESAWVLESVFGVSAADIGKALALVMAKPAVILESPHAVEALKWYAGGMDMADAIHLAGAADRQCEKLLTFDKDFARRAKGKTACVAAKPV